MVVFEQLKKAEWKLKPLKCKFFKQELTYLGHVVSKNGKQTDSKKVEAIPEMAHPNQCHRNA